MSDGKLKHRPWTRAEVAAVIALRLAGYSVWLIGATVGRNGSSVGALIRKPEIEDRILKAQGLS